MTTPFDLTEKQKAANLLLASQATHVLLRGGSRSGKTFLAVRAMVVRALKAKESRHGIFRLHQNALRASVWKDTFPKVMRLCFPSVPVKKYQQEMLAVFPGGSELMLCGLDDDERVEKILGLEFATVFFNEGSQIPYSSVETALTRLAQKAEYSINGETHELALKAIYDLNPPTKLHWSFRQWFEHLKPDTREALARPDNYVSLLMNPEDNSENLSSEYIDMLDSMSAAKQRRFKKGEYSEAAEGALWTYDVLDRHRLSPDQELPDFARVVVGVDPSGAADAKSDADKIGIVAAALGVDGRYYVTEDRSCILGPSGWARRAGETYHDTMADLIVAEKNFGGAMVEAVIKAYDKDIPVKMVTASRGKVVRAEPISTLHEEGKVSHVGHFTDLEDEMCAMTTTGFQGEGSPDRLDAMVWALTELSANEFAEPQVRAL